MISGIQFNTLTLRNFLSFGNQPTKIDLRGDHITVVLGINHDTGGDESRNGVGKSALIDAISYALFGKSIRGISNSKLVNKLARKGQGMLVVLEFDTPEGHFRIERGEAPSKLRLFKKEIGDENDFLDRDGKTFIYEKSQGKNETTAEIERIIGLDLKLFEFLVANTSETDAFMKLPEEKKREIAERLMGLNLLTERAKELKEDRKIANRDLVAGESAMEATKRANERIEEQIRDLETKATRWDEQRERRMEELRDLIAEMESVDTAEQIEVLKLLDDIESEQKRINAERREGQSALREAQRNLRDLNTTIDDAAKRFEDLGKQRRKLEQSICPTCEQHWVPNPSVLETIIQEIDQISDFSEESVTLLETAETEVSKAQKRLDEIAEEEKELGALTKEVSEFELMFESIEDASAVGAQLEASRRDLTTVEKAENPHTDTILGLREAAIQKIDDGEVRGLRKLITHYNYLIDLLQSRDSFLRKAVIDRWLPRLNGRIAHYLDILELPYVVRIENDLNMTVEDFGETYEWGNLSKGQRQRVTIALNLAFQDLFEATNHPLSLLMVDELIDSGICNRGASQALVALRETCEAKKKRVFLITHRLDIADQIDDTLLIELRNRISRIEEDETE